MTALELIKKNMINSGLDSSETFSPVSFSVGAGEKVCLQGKNGCGKTSLLKLIAQSRKR